MHINSRVLGWWNTGKISSLNFAQFLGQVVPADLVTL
jgi:hypothetical protein